MKKSYFMLTTIIFLIMAPMASAFTVDLEDHKGTYSGLDVNLLAHISMNEDEYPKYRDYSILSIRGPNGFSESCKILDNESFEGCSLDLDVKIEMINPREIFYDITWHTDINQDFGEYKAVVIAVETFSEQSSIKISESEVGLPPEGIAEHYSNEITFKLDDTSENCVTLYNLFKDSYHSKAGESNYEPMFDFDLNTVIDIADFGILGLNFNNDDWCYDKIPNPDEVCTDLFDLLSGAYGAKYNEADYDERVDFNHDDIIDIIDLGIYTINYRTPNWCDTKYNVDTGDDDDDNGNGGGRHHYTYYYPPTEQPQPEEEEIQEKVGPQVEEKPTGLSAITGSVIGFLDSISSNPFVLVILLLAILLTALYFRNKRK